jgi:pimeloyl-ACP methyl ester carboxylesterase
MNITMTNSYQTRPAEILCEDTLIPSDTAGIRLHLRRKRPAAVKLFPPERTVLMMHGATFSSMSLFDVPVGGSSFMDHLALAGFDVYAVDVRGYGGSTLLPEMTAPADAAAPLVGIETAVRDLAAAVDHILEHHRLARLNLLAMSWGGSVAGAYAASHNAKVARLTLIAPLWLTQTRPRIDKGGTLGAYRDVDVWAYEESWRAAAPESQRRALIPEGWFEAWAQATLASDPGADQPGLIRVPSGAVQDIREHWAVNRPFYDPADIRVPVLLIHAEWDADVTTDTIRDLFGRLTAAPYRRWTEIGGGTHMVVLEKNRWQVSNAVTAFLNEVPD